MTLHILISLHPLSDVFVQTSNSAAKLELNVLWLLLFLLKHGRAKDSHEQLSDDLSAAFLLLQLCFLTPGN